MRLTAAALAMVNGEQTFEDKISNFADGLHDKLLQDGVIGGDPQDPLFLQQSRRSLIVS